MDTTRFLSLFALLVGCSSPGPMTNPQGGPPAGWPDGHASVPAEGQAEDISTPTTVIGDGSAAPIR